MTFNVVKFLSKYPKQISCKMHRIHMFQASKHNLYAIVAIFHNVASYIENKPNLCIINI